MKIIGESQKQLGDMVWRKSERSRRNSIHIQINSLLIHIKDHLDYLGYLLSAREHIGAYNIALNSKERELVIRKITNGTQLGKWVRESSLKYSFRMLDPHCLCIIIDIPLQPALQSIGAVRPYPLPSILNDTLMTPSPESHPFLQFHGSFFVTLDQHTFHGCVKNGFCEGPNVPEIADDQANCTMHQFFHNASATCPRRTIQDKRYLLYAGSSLFYSTIQPLQVQFQCHNQDEERIKSIRGKGVLETPKSCRIISSKAFFSEPKPSKTFVLTNQSEWPTLKISEKIVDNLRSDHGSRLQGKLRTPEMNLVKIPSSHEQLNDSEILIWIKYLKPISTTIFFVVCTSMCLLGMYFLTKERNGATRAVDL